MDATTSTSWNAPENDGWNDYYKVSAVDYVGSESDPASPESSSGVDTKTIPVYTAFYQNHPNPFNPVTQIRYDVPAPEA